MVLGAKELVDVLLNLATVLKVRSGLAIVSQSADDKMAVAYLCAGVISGFYLVAGGGLLSVIAFGRRAARAELYGDVGLPDGRSFVGLAFLGFGANQMIQAVTSAALAVAYYHRPLSEVRPLAPRLYVVEAAWMFEHLVIGFLLLTFGMRVARYFTGGQRPNQSPEPTVMSVTPPAAQEPRQP
jgi:hypothetical protein